MDMILACERQAIEAEMRGLAEIVELLAEPRGDLLVDLRHGDRAVVALVDAEREAELGQIRLHRGGHVGILQLAGERAAVEGFRAMHLTERGRARGLTLEA